MFGLRDAYPEVSRLRDRSGSEVIDCHSQAGNTIDGGESANRKTPERRSKEIELRFRTF